MKVMTTTAGICGVLHFVVSLAAIAMVSQAGVTEQQLEQGAAEIYLPRMAQEPVLFVTSMWLFNAASVLVLGFGLGLAETLRRHRPWLRLGVFSFLLSSLSFVTETMMTIGVAQVLAPAYVEATGGARDLLLQTTLALIQFRNHTALFAGVLLALGTLVVGTAVLRAPAPPTLPALPEWLGAVALAVGGLGLVGGLAPLAAPLSLVRSLAVALFRLWSLVVGVLLLRGSLKRRTHAAAPG